MTPDMSLGQWLLVTLTAGVGGSMLSIGSAAGVALMGQSKGYYTFVSHLKWIWAIASRLRSQYFDPLYGLTQHFLMSQSRLFADIGNSAVKWRTRDSEVFTQSVDLFSSKLLPKADLVWLSAVAHLNIVEEIKAEL